LLDQAVRTAKLTAIIKELNSEHGSQDASPMDRKRLLTADPFYDQLMRRVVQRQIESLEL
jgi:hypothetical protein